MTRFQPVGKKESCVRMDASLDDVNGDTRKHAEFLCSFLPWMLSSCRHRDHLKFWVDHSVGNTLGDFPWLMLANRLVGRTRAVSLLLSRESLLYSFRRSRRPTHLGVIIMQHPLRPRTVMPGHLDPYSSRERSIKRKSKPGSLLSRHERPKAKKV